MSGPVDPCPSLEQHFPPDRDFLAAISADGGRSHVLAQWAADGAPGTLRLAAHDDTGWAEVLLASEWPYGRFSTGYRNGKRWVLTWSQVSTDTCAASVYVEP